MVAVFVLGEESWNDEDAAAAAAVLFVTVAVEVGVVVEPASAVLY